MPRIEVLDKIPRRVLPVFFVLDISSNMSGGKIAALNRTMRETLAYLKEKTRTNTDADLQVGFLAFDDGFQWLYQDRLMRVEDSFVWTDLQVGGPPQLDPALRELNRQLSIDGYLSSSLGNYLPIIVFMMDGQADINCSPELGELHKNRWFQRAAKIGFAIGDDANREWIGKIVGSEEAVVSDIRDDAFSKMIRFYSGPHNFFPSWSQGNTTGSIGEDSAGKTEASGSDYESPKRVLPVFYVLDTSSGMAGDTITILNEAMKESIAEMGRMAEQNTGTEVRFAVLACGTECQWMDPDGPKSVEGGFVWKQLQAGGSCNVGMALKELNEKLSENAYLGDMNGNYLPIFLFIMSGHAVGSYAEELRQLRENRWFQRATKIGCAVGDGTDLTKEMLCNIVGNSEAIVDTSDLTLFSRMIRFVEIDEDWRRRNLYCGASSGRNRCLRGKRRTR